MTLEKLIRLLTDCLEDVPGDTEISVISLGKQTRASLEGVIIHDKEPGSDEAAISIGMGNPESLDMSVLDYIVGSVEDGNN